MTSIVMPLLASGMLPQRVLGLFAGAIDALCLAPDSIRESFERAGAIHGELMFNNRKQTFGAARQPDHTARITPTLSVSVWQSRDSETGQIRMHWDVSRINSENPSKTYKTLRVESLLEFPTFLATVASGFAQTEAVGPKLRSELLQFAKDMELLAGTRQEHEGAAKEVPEKTQCIF